MGTESGAGMARTWKFDPDLGCSEDGSFFCCWAECCEQLVTLDELKDHLDAHLNRQILSGGGLVCQVEGCGLEAEDELSLFRHTLFHCYHAEMEGKGLVHIKSKGHGGETLAHCNHHNQNPNRLFFAGEQLGCYWDHCERRFDDVLEFFRHVLGHVDLMDRDDRTEEGTFACRWKGCSGKNFQKKSYLKNHMQHHSGAKKFGCPFCGSFLANTTKMSDHILRKLSTRNSRLKCFCCQKTFSTQRLLKEHMRRHVKKLKCRFCPMTCETPSDLRYHTKIRHEREKDYTCATCSKTFSRRPLLLSHLTKHNEESDKHLCSECGKGFKWKSALLEHIRLKHSEREVCCYLCHMCPKRYSRGNILSKHLQKQHLIKIPPGFAKFSYKTCEDGYYRLQTERYESVELAAELQSLEESQREEETESLVAALVREDEERPRMVSTQLNIPADLRDISGVHHPSDTQGILAQWDMGESETGKKLHVTLTDETGNVLTLERLSELTLVVNGKEIPPSHI